jgi:hypothetical protein
VRCTALGAASTELTGPRAIADTAKSRRPLRGSRRAAPHDVASPTSGRLSWPRGACPLSCAGPLTAAWPHHLSRARQRASCALRAAGPVLAEPAAARRDLRTVQRAGGYLDIAPANRIRRQPACAPGGADGSAQRAVESAAGPAGRGPPISRRDLGAVDVDVVVAQRVDRHVAVAPSRPRPSP